GALIVEAGHQDLHAFSLPAHQRAVLAAGPLGIMQDCLDVVLPYVRDRKQFGKAIGDFQLMKGKIADMYVALNSARAYV
ncbi:acyl-CoA dehydrogenase family protein, partial [Rhizobium leguminosarum]|uniref:acyl-CoA dehydrogenase family protein n=1 Tax=Rhizobium leguminosarum TaxID=384 RepID=UPI003F9DD40A